LFAVRSLTARVLPNFVLKNVLKQWNGCGIAQRLQGFALFAEKLLSEVSRRIFVRMSADAMSRGNGRIGISVTIAA
jgi:hypothetical protein